MSEFTKEELRAMDIKTAIMVLSKGADLPEYMASLPIPDRLIVVRAINEFQPGALSDQMKRILVAYPEVLNQIIDPAIAGLMNNLATLARAEMATWEPEQLVEDLRKIVDKVNARKHTPAQNARYN